MPCRGPYEHMEDDASRERRHMLVRCLCCVCEHLERTDQQGVIETRPELAAFWAEHKAADARRAERAAQKMSTRERRRLDNLSQTDAGIINSATRKLRYTLTPTELRILRQSRGWPWRLFPDSLDGINSEL